LTGASALQKRTVVQETHSVVQRRNRQLHWKQCSYFHINPEDNLSKTASENPGRGPVQTGSPVNFIGYILSVDESSHIEFFANVEIIIYKGIHRTAPESKPMANFKKFK